MKDISQKQVLPDIGVIYGNLIGQVLYDAYSELKVRYFPRAAVVLSAYHPRAFFDESRLGPTPDTRVMATLLNTLPSENISFMNETVRRTHEEYFKKSFSASAIAPVAINLQPVPAIRRRTKDIKIVTIGRLVSFKNYFLSTIDAVAQLRDEGLSIEFHIYGDGPLRSSLLKGMQERNAATFTYWHGELPVHELPNVLKTATYFVGMGTSLLEACAAGVPSIIAIEGNESSNYGWFHNTKGYELGENVPLQKTYTYVEMFQSILNMSDDEYQNMCRESWERANQFSIELLKEKYYAFFENANADYTFSLSPLEHALVKLARQAYKLDILRKPEYLHR